MNTVESGIKAAYILLLIAACSAPGATTTDGEDAHQAVRAAIENRSFASAAGQARAGLGQDPGDVELWNLLGIAESESGHSEVACEAFLKGLGLAPKSSTLAENLGLEYFRQANYAKAKRFLEQAITNGSGNVGARFSLAASRLRTGEESKGLQDLRALENALDDRPEYWEERGNAELLHSPVEAESSFNRALSLAPGRLNTLNGAARAAETQHLDEKALSYMVQARQQAPNDVPTLLHFSSICLRMDLGPDALQASEQARRLAPANLAALYLEARANVSLQNWERALSLFEQFAQREPRYPVTYYAMGWVNVRLNRPAAARQALQRCLQLAPALTEALYELATLDIEDGNLVKAESELRTLLARDAGHAKANLSLGDLLSRRGRLAEARACLEFSISTDPGSAAAHYKLAQVLTRLHDEIRARQEQTVAATLNEKSQQKAKIQLRLVLPEDEPNAQSDNAASAAKANSPF